MTRNKKLITAAAAAAALVLAPVAALASTGSPAGSQGPTVIHVVEHAITDTVQMFHPPKESLGDVLGFHNPVFNASNTKKVGMDNGFCIRTVATGKTEWECAWTTRSPPRSSVVQVHSHSVLPVATVRMQKPLSIPTRRVLDAL